MSSGNTLSKVVFTVRDTFINGYLAVRYVLKRSSPMGLQTGSITADESGSLGLRFAQVDHKYNVGIYGFISSISDLEFYKSLKLNIYFYQQRHDKIK